MNTTMKVTIENKFNLKIVRYQYQAGGCMDFDLNLFCEVGEPYKPMARAQLSEILRNRYPGCKVSTIDLPHKPWVVDVIEQTSRETACATSI